MFFNLKSKIHSLEYFQNAVKGSSLAFLHPSYKAWHFIFSYVPNARALVHVNGCFLTATSLLSKKIYKAAKKQTNKQKNQTNKQKPAFSITFWEAEVLDLIQSFSTLF